MNILLSIMYLNLKAKQPNVKIPRKYTYDEYRHKYTISWDF
jgi:hypothetical protein